MATTYKVTLKQGAFDDLDKIYQFISQDSPVRAKQFLSRLQKQISALKKFPFRGSSLSLLGPELAQRIRYISYQGYMVFYEITAADVRVLHITGPGQDWLRHFL